MSTKLCPCGKPMFPLMRTPPGDTIYYVCTVCDMTNQWSPNMMLPEMRRGYIPLEICHCAGCERLRGVA